MPRRCRFDCEGYFYHIIARGQRKNPIFFSSKDMDNFLKILSKILEKTDTILCAYCAIRNHYHLVVYRQKMSLENFMRHLNTKYAVYFNRKYKLTGHVFQDRYKSFIVLNESYLLNLIKYVHMNPVKAGIVKTPEEYEYSSASIYKDKKSAQSFLGNDVPKILKDNLTKISSPIDGKIEKIPIYQDCIGTAIDFLSFEKRIGKSEKGKFTERRGKKSNLKFKDALNLVLENYGIGLQDFLNLKFSKIQKNKNIKKNVFKKLIKIGFFQAEIARELNFAKSTVSKILKN